MLTSQLSLAAWLQASLATVALAAPPPSWQLGAKWQFEIQQPLDTKAALVPEADIWDIDLWQAYKSRQNDPPGKSVTDFLHSKNKTVICYYNFGAVQPEDCDFADWKNNNLWNGVWYGDIPGNDLYCERYVDLKNAGVVSRLKQRLDIAAQAGCDGVDPDNIDLYNAVDITKEEVVAVLKDMATYAHSKGLLIGQKNAEELVNDLVGVFDFAILESCVQGNFCNAFQPYISKGKPVSDIEYPASLQDSSATAGCRASGISSSDQTKFCRNGQTAVPTGFSEVLKLNFDEYGLNGCTQYCGTSKPEITKTNSESGNSCGFTFPNCNSDAELKKNLCCK